MASEQKKKRSLEERMYDLESAIQGVYRLHGLSPTNKPRADSELMAAWTSLQKLGAKKEWDEPDIMSAVEFAWYLTQDDLRRLERLTETRLCWLSIFQLLDIMRLKLIANENFEGNYVMHVVEARIRGAISNLEKATLTFMIRYAPELHDAVQEHIHAFADDLTPEFSPAAIF